MIKISLNQIQNNNYLTRTNLRVKKHYKYCNRICALIFIFLSLIFLLIMITGSTSGTVYLKKFSFDPVIVKFLQTKSITFTLLGFCIDNACTKEIFHNFDKGKFDCNQNFKIEIN